MVDLARVSAGLPGRVVAKLETTNPGGTPFTEMIVASPLYAYFSSMMPGDA